MEKKTVSSFPDPFVSKESKQQDSYGLEYARAIWSEYTRNGILYNARRTQDIENRKYAEGLESFDKYKDRLGLNGDTSWLNLDFSPVNRIASLVDNMEGKMTNQGYKIQCNPIDIISKTQQDKDRDEMYANMFLRQQTSDIEQMTGIPMYPRDKKIPQSDEEAELYFKMNYKQASSIAMEQALSFVFMNNNFDQDTRKKIIRDLIILKRAVIHRFYDENNNIRVRREDPVDVITPYSKHDDFRNIPYVAVLEQITIGDIAQMTDKFDDTQLADIAKRYQGQYNNPMWDSAWGSYEGYYPNSTFGAVRPYYNFNIPVLRFYFITTCKENWVKVKKNNGRVYFDSKGEDYTTDAQNKEVVQKRVQYVFEGYWIVGSNDIFNYTLSKNIPRENDNGSYSPKAELPISIIAPNIYDMQNKSPVERAIVFEDQLNITHLKIQQLVVTAKPPGYWIDKEAMSGIMLGQGDTPAKPTDIYRMFAQTGSMVGSSIRDDGSMISGSPIIALPNGLGEDFAVLINYFRQQLQNMNDVIGYNTAVDASSPDVETAVGTSKMAIQATNNALRPLYQAHISLIEKTAKGIALMIQDSINYNTEAFMRAIGTQATETIKYGKNLAYNQFAIKIELLPDEEEKMNLKSLVALGLEKGTLKTSDAILIDQVMNQDVKLAAQYLVYLENKNRKDAMDEAAAQQEQNGQIQQQSAMVAAQATAQAEQAITQQKIQLLTVEFQFKQQLSAQEHQQTLKEIQEKNVGAMEQKRVDHDGNLMVEAFKMSAPQQQSETRV